MRTRRWALGALSVATATATAAGALPAAATGSAGRPLPTKQHFYRYTGSTPLAKIARGTVLKKRTVDVSLGTDSTPVQAQQLLYRTVDERHRPAVTVTTVLLPKNAPATPRVVGYLSFYDALGSECDPSYTLAGGDAGSSANQQQAEEEEAIISTYLDQGFIVTVPDFEGEQLDWAAGQESGRTTIDGLKATLAALGLPRTSPVGLTGYSGGSIAADWASELAPHDAPRLDIVGVAEGGIPVDFAHNLRYINGSPSWSGVIPAVLVSVSRAFGVDVHRYLSAKGRRITHKVRHQCIGSFVGNYPGLKVQSLLKHRYRDFVHVPVFARIVNRLLMGSAKGHPQEPLFMAVGRDDGTGDGVMVSKDVEGLAHEYCKQGVKLTFSLYKKSDHDQAAVQFEPNALTFLQQRFAGAPFQSGCSSVGKGNALTPVKAHHRHRHHAHG